MQVLMRPRTPEVGRDHRQLAAEREPAGPLRRPAVGGHPPVRAAGGFISRTVLVPAPPPPVRSPGRVRSSVPTGREGGWRGPVTALIVMTVALPYWWRDRLAARLARPGSPGCFRFLISIPGPVRAAPSCRRAGRWVPLPPVQGLAAAAPGARIDPPGGLAVTLTAVHPVVLGCAGGPAGGGVSWR